MHTTTKKLLLIDWIEIFFSITSQCVLSVVLSEPRKRDFMYKKYLPTKQEELPYNFLSSCCKTRTSRQFADTLSARLCVAWDDQNAQTHKPLDVDWKFFIFTNKPRKASYTAMHIQNTVFTTISCAYLCALKTTASLDRFKTHLIFFFSDSSYLHFCMCLSAA